MSDDKQLATGDEYTPKWARRAEYIPHKPEWIDGIPHKLWELGEVFFPIPNRQKAWKYPHHIGEKRHAPDSEILNAYLESNSNYGIACANELAVVDIDETEYIDHIKEQLPDTVWQWSGSRSGVHLFFKCSGLNTRIILRIPLPQPHVTAEGIENISGGTSQHIGEVKCDPHGYVVGPGSTHPSGGKYGPLEGSEIASISEEQLRKGLSQYVNDTSTMKQYATYERYHAQELDTSKYEFYNLDPDDVVPWLGAGKRVPHPVHGSSTGSNFMKVPEEDVFMCWRHNYDGNQGCALNPQQLLAVMATSRECDEVRRRWNSEPPLHYKAWLEATERGIISSSTVPYRIVKGYAIQEDWMSTDGELDDSMYWDALNAVRCIAQEKYVPSSKPE